MTRPKPLTLALRLSFPVLLAYFPLGLVFGVVAAQLHEPWFYAPIMSVALYAGAVQFVAIGLMVTHASYFTIFMSTIFIALRNVFYGPFVMNRFNVSLPKKLFLIYGLVDSTYAILISTPPYEDPQQDQRFCLTLTLLVLCYWASGTLVGAIFSHALSNLKGLEFILIAFFTVLIMDQFQKNKNIFLILLSLITFVLSAWLSPNNMLLPAILACFGILCITFYKEEYFA